MPALLVCAIFALVTASHASAQEGDTAPASEQAAGSEAAQSSDAHEAEALDPSEPAPAGADDEVVGEPAQTNLAAVDADPQSATGRGAVQASNAEPAHTVQADATLSAANGGEPGNSIVDLATFDTTPLFDPSTPVVDGAGNIWFGTNSGNIGVARVSGDLSGTPTIDVFDAGVVNPYTGVLGSRGTVWFGTGTTAILRISHDLSGTPTFTALPTPAGISNTITPIVGPNAAIWFGNEDGASNQVIRVSGDLLANLLLTAIVTPLVNPETAVVDDVGNIWFGNEFGDTHVVRLSGDLLGVRP